MEGFYRESTNATHLWLSTLARFVGSRSEGTPPYETVSRLGRVSEYRAAHLTLLNPRQRWMWLAERRASLKLALVETLQLLAGISVPSMLTYLAPRNYGQAINPATGELDGAHGPRIAEQLPYILRLLKQEPETRRAVITLYDQRDQHLSNDVPCAVSLQFFRRGGELHLVNHMRSNDVWLGLPYDIFAFTTLQELVATLLNDDIGTYTHLVGSLHLYETYKDIASEIVARYMGSAGLWIWEQKGLPNRRGPLLPAIEEGGRARDLATLPALGEGWPSPVHYTDIQTVAKETLDAWSKTRVRRCDYDVTAHPAPRTARGPEADETTLQGFPPFFRMALSLLTHRHEEGLV